MDHITRFAYILRSKTQSSKAFIKLINIVADNNKIGTILADKYPGISSGKIKEYLNDKDITLIHLKTG